MALRAFQTVLNLAGLTFADIHVKELEWLDADDANARATQALRSGEVEVIYLRGANAGGTQARYHFDKFLNFSPLKDARHRINTNTPRLILASRHLVETYLYRVIAYFQALIRAGRWAQNLGPLRKSVPGLAPSLDDRLVEAFQNQAVFYSAKA